MSNVESRLLESSNPLWEAVIREIPHMPYHAPAWCEAMATIDGGTAVAIHCTDGESEFFCPLVRRSISDGHWDAVSPYPYCPPLSNSSQPDFLRAALLSSSAFLAQSGGVAWLMRLHPVASKSLQLPVGHTQSHGRTVCINLESSGLDDFSSFRSGHRYDIRKALKAGCKVERLDWSEHLKTFHELYLGTMDRVDSTDFYKFSFELLECIFSADPTGLQLWGVTLGNKLICSAIFTLSSDKKLIDYFLSAANESYLHLAPTKLLIAEFARHAQREGWARLNLGGGLGSREDSLFKFKRGFSDLTFMYRTHRLVLDPATYDELCGQVGAARNLESYFPAYR